MGAFRPIIPNFTFTVSDLLANSIINQGKFVVSCAECKDWRVLTNEQMAELVLKNNPLWSPWNRKPPCPTCGRGRSFHATPGTSGPSRVLTTTFPEDVVDLHYAHRRERNRRLKQPGDR